MARTQILVHRWWQDKDFGAISQTDLLNQSLVCLWRRLRAYHCRDLGGGCGGAYPTPYETTCGILIQLVFCKTKLCGLLVLK